MNYNSLAPPPLAPLIPGDGYLSAGGLGTSSARSMWPTHPYGSVITKDTTLSFAKEIYTYFLIRSDNPITLTLTIIPVGYILIIEFEGAGSINVIMDGLPLSSVLTSGTYMIAKFTDFIRYVRLSNPTSM